MILQKLFRERVLEALEVRGITKAELARRMSVVGPYVHQYLSGRFSPGLDVIEKFALGLECHPSALLSTEPFVAEQPRRLSKVS